MDFKLSLAPVFKTATTTVKASELKANLHFIDACNAHCRGCFATEFPGENHMMSVENAHKTIINLFAAGVTQFNLAGGEPTIHPHFTEICRFICELGGKVSVITNGSRLNEAFLEKVGPYLDTIGLSIDSFDRETSYRLGRFIGSPRNPKFFGFDELKALLHVIRKYSIRLKVNTVISNVNFEEKMSEKISELNVDRWKIIKMSPYNVGGHSNLDLVPSDEEYQHFIQNNLYRHSVIESDMKNSYLVIDPNGNLLDNSNTAAEKDSGYRIIGNFIMETASMVLKRYFNVFNVNAYRERYV